MTRTALLAMSGGVDSSVAACLLRQAGWTIRGAFLRMLDAAELPPGCRVPGDAAAARRAAEALGVELDELDCREAFGPIVRRFAEAYARGRTPNPCLWCNAQVKFAALLRRAEDLGFSHVATGHHARLLDADSPAIARGRDRAKDQSYALFALPRDWLRRIVLPIGRIDSKDTVRRIAAEQHLPARDAMESQDACFVAGDDYVAVLRGLAPQALQAGTIVNAAGQPVGRHDGYGRFTIGQRRGIGVAAREPMYVTGIDAATAMVRIGPKAEVMTDRLTASGANWHADLPEEFDAAVQIRYNHAGAAARIRRLDADRFEVRFAESVSAVTPGQGAVVYDGDRLLGGGWID